MEANDVQYHQQRRDHSDSTRSQAQMQAPEAQPTRHAKRDENDDRDLVRRVANKDRKAFEILYYRHTPRLSRYLSRFVRRPDVVEEIVNDVMLVLWQRASDYDDRARLSTWLFGIAHNKGLKALSKLSRQSARETDYEVVDATAQAQSGTDQLVQDDASRVLNQALEILSAEQRAVVELTYYWGFSYPEIANIVDCPTNTVKTRMFHARRRLKEHLVGRGFASAWKTLVDVQ